ncbi:MAG: Gfo/Idh/MocA family oxidoreductase [Armatimonadota bacterium]|nr:Gfo/Idh/MocA family oxidoreductase [Armatimonadota bacterium]
MLSVAICGAGGLGRNHAENFDQIPDTEVTLVYDVVDEAAEALAEDVVARPAEQESDLWGDDVDIVVVTTPTPFHHDYTVKAAQAGKHVFCEKPMCRDMEQAEEMLQAVEEAGVTFMVGHVLRFFAEYVRARKLILDGVIGDVGIARTSRINTLPGGPESWFSNYEMSGGVTLDMTIHDFDWLLWTFGPAERVYSLGVPERMPPIDYGLTTIRFESGVIAHCEGSWADLGQFRTHFDIAGTDGLLRHSSTDMPTLTVQRRGEQEGVAAVQVPESPAAKSPYLLEDEHFVQCVLNGTQPAVSGEDARAAVEVALAALESNESHGEVIEL